MLYKSIVIGFVFGTLAVLPAGAQAPTPVPLENAAKASLTVRLTDIRNDKGQVFIQLWNAPEGFPKQPFPITSSPTGTRHLMNRLAFKFRRPARRSPLRFTISQTRLVKPATLSSWVG